MIKSVIYNTKKGIYLFWSLFFIALPVINFVPELHFLKAYTIPVLVFYFAMKIIKKVTKAIFYTGISIGLIYLLNYMF